MKISVFGLGYVGAVCCACFGREGHDVIGVDISKTKIDLINSGKSPIVEKDLDETIQSVKQSGHLHATQDAKDAILKSDISFLCVGTPSQLNGSIDLTYIYKVCEQIGEVLKEKKTFHTVVIRSTVVPGTLKNCAGIIEHFSGKKLNEDFGMVSNPEFLREGTAIYDFKNPPYTVIGASCEKSGNIIGQLYEELEAPIYQIKPEESEMIKYANNNFHAMKITFANEIGNICKSKGIDSHVVMDIVSKDSKLNLSPYYLKPGFAFGGSCLPKDVRGLNYLAKSEDVDTPMLASFLDSNENQKSIGLQMIMSTNRQKIGFLGFAFKAGTDDMRESPMVDLIESLIGKGFDISLYDSNVMLSNLMGKNRDFLTNRIPHIYKLLKEDLDQVIEESEVLVIGNKSPEFQQVFTEKYSDKIIIDLVRIDPNKISSDNYAGICW